MCEIYTDVDGVYTTDPRICPQARKLERISYDEMLELASLGAKVLQIRSVEFAKRYDVPVHVRSSFDERDGTWVVPEDERMEQVLVSGVSLDRDQAKITVRHVPDRPGLAFAVLGPIAKANIVVDMIIQNASSAGDTDLTFTVPKTDFRRALAMVEQTAKEIGAQGVSADTEVVKVSVVGLGMRSHAGVAASMFEVLAREGINIQMISTSEIKISVVIDAKYGELAVRALHAALVERSSWRAPRVGAGRSGAARAWSAERDTDRHLRHDAARRLPGGGHRAHARGQAAHRRAPGRLRHRLRRGRLAGLEPARRGVLRRGRAS